MKNTNSNSFRNAQLRLKAACDKLGYEDSIYQILKEPSRVIEISIPVKMDDGSLEVFKGYRVVHNDSLGPAKGGIRFHTDVDGDEIKALSIWMSLKCGIAGLPYGGAKGGITVDPTRLSQGELERLSRGYIDGIYKYIGERIDIPGPDVNTNAQIMAWMVDQYCKLTGTNSLGVITGKPVYWGGSQGRTEATGYGLSVICKTVLKKLGRDIKGSTVAIQGFGNVGGFSAKHLEKQGAKIVSIAKRGFAIYNEKGLYYDDIMDFLSKDKDLRNYPKAKVISIDEFWSLNVDIMLPAALGNVIDADIAEKIKATIVCEGANGPITPSGDEVLDRKGILVVPDVLANSGGVTVSYFEWVQNQYGYYWTEEEVFEKEESVLIRAFNDIWNFKEELNSTFREAAYMHSVRKMAEVMKTRGWC